ncbi:MAG TPA: FAD-dependent monooxygenase [Streptosporangiaceae bacterium]
MSQPVVIAGGGPVGMMLACELGLEGVETIVMEKLSQPDDHSRGMAINAGVVELLSQRGLMEPLRSEGFEFPLAHFAHLRLDPTRLGGQHPYAFAVPHNRLVRHLEDRAVKLGVNVRRGTEVLGLDQDETGVEVRVRSGEASSSIRGCYLVGCDGAGSTVRDLAQIAFPGTDSPFSGILGDIDVEAGDPLFARLGINQHQAGFFTVGPLGPQILRIATGEFGVQPPDHEAPVGIDELRAAVNRISGADLVTGTPRWLSRWHVATRQAERYRAGRVFLAGDAAHVHFPLGGQALSTGIEDAVNLGWKLAADVNGWAPAELLDSYHAERYPAGTRACMTTRAQEALLHPMDKVTPLREILAELIQFEEVNAYLVSMVGGLDVRYSFRYPGIASETEPHPLMGTRLRDVPLTTAAGDTSVARLLENGRGLLIDFSDGAAPGRMVARWPGRLDHVRAEPVPEIQASALLLRPDGRVAWAGQADDPDSPAALAHLRAALHSWFGEPSR